MSATSIGIRPHHELSVGQPMGRKPSDGVQATPLRTPREIDDPETRRDGTQGNGTALIQDGIVGHLPEERIPVPSGPVDVMETVTHVSEHAVDIEDGYTRGGSPLGI